MAEFGERLKTVGLDEETQSRIEQLIGEAAGEFPCLSCPSKDELQQLQMVSKVVRNTKINAPANSNRLTSTFGAY